MMFIRGEQFTSELGLAKKVLKTSQSFLLAIMISFTFLPVMAEASEIMAISLTASAGGEVVTIQSDTSAEYEIYDLDGPPRLVIMFPEATIATDVKQIKSDKAVVSSVFPVKSETGVRIEIGLNEVVEYDVGASDDSIEIHFAKAEKDGGASKVAAVIKDIEVRDIGSVSELVLRGEHMDVNHNAFLTDNNQTLILDFWGATSSLPKEFYQYATQRIRNVVVGEAEGRLRLVIGLLPGGEMKHQIESNGGELVVKVGNVSQGRKADAIVVQGVVFQPDDRIAHIMVTTDGQSPIVNINEKDGNVIIDLKKAVLAEGQERSQDVSGFPGPVKQVDTYKVNDSVRIVARLRDEVDITSIQQGNVFTVNLEPEDLYLARSGGDNTRDEFAYSGQKVTFDFKDIDIRNALKLISEMSDLNIIMSDDVSGNLTMRLVDVPWDQALDLILAARGLGQEKTGNVMRIASVEVLRKEYESKLQARRGSEQLEPLVTEFITLNFTKVDEVKKMLEGASANATKGGGNASQTTSLTDSGSTSGTSTETSVGILSPRGSFLVDARTNTLVVKDTQKAINSIKRLIATIDQPLKQVLIEARIVEATDNFSREMGISWGGSYQSPVRNGGTVAIGPVDGVAGDNIVAGTVPGTRGRLVDLPAATGAGAGGGIGLAIGTVKGMLELELSAAEADDDIKIVSNPRVVTTNLKTAIIDQGTEIPFTSVSQNGTNVQFKKATLGLEVTPQITADDRVILTIVVSKDSPTSTAVGTDQNVLISTKRVETEVFLDTGETVVIGGIFTRDKNNTVAGVPLLMDIPVLGWLFKKKKVRDDKNELLVFLTPTVLKTKKVSIK